ncbi:MAG TPA: porin family protein [Candidatus Syntrophosphaera sp.]|nr:porin family protein [Candidatus Syntrophosphaera sp.]
MKFIIITALVAAISVGVFATKPTLGLKAGLNLSRLSELDGFETHLPGANLSCLVQFPVSPNILLQPEISYNEKGEFWAAPLGIVGGWRKISYLETTVLVKYNLPVGKVFLQPHLGPSLGVLLSAREKNGSIYSDNPVDMDVRDSLNWIDIGVNVGLDLVLGRHFVLGIRYDTGLINVNKNKNTDKNYNRSYIVNLGYLFGKRVNKEDKSLSTALPAQSVHESYQAYR